MALNTVSSDRLSTNVKNTNFTAAEKQDLTDDILPLAGQLGNRNLIINGAMQVAQRGTSSSVDGYSTIDRFRTANSANNENPSQAQVDVASGTTPYTLGFRKAFKLTNGNQTGGVSNADADVAIRYSVEAQDLAQSGWNHKSTSSFITLSFWVKASVAQNYYGYFLTLDGTTRIYPFETGSLTADTWTKVTKIIPGNSILDVTNDNGEGLRIEWRPYTGTNKTDSGVTLNAWATFASATRTPVSPTGWYTTNDATFEITGVQLEVGSVATDFEHRSFAQELALCQRYFYMHASGQFDLVNTDRCPIGLGYGYTSTAGFVMITFPTLMRTDPSLYKVVGTDYFSFAYNGNNSFPNDISVNRMSSQVAELSFHTGSSWDQNAAGMFRTYNTAARVGFSAEL